MTGGVTRGSRGCPSQTLCSPHSGTASLNSAVMLMVRSNHRQSRSPFLGLAGCCLQCPVPLPNPSRLKEATCGQWGLQEPSSANSQVLLSPESPWHLASCSAHVHLAHGQESPTEARRRQTGPALDTSFPALKLRRVMTNKTAAL